MRDQLKKGKKFIIEVSYKDNLHCVRCAMSDHDFGVYSIHGDLNIAINNAIFSWELTLKDDLKILLSKIQEVGILDKQIQEFRERHNV